MRKFKLIFKATNSVKLWIRSIFKWGLLLFICYLLTFFIFVPTISHYYNSGVYKYPTFDISFYAYMKSDLDTIVSENPNIKQYAATRFSSQGGDELVSSKGIVHPWSKGIVGDSMRPFFDLVISPELCSDYDYSLMEKENAIFIKYLDSKTLNVKVGDTIQMNYMDNGVQYTKDMIVAAIFGDVLYSTYVMTSAYYLANVVLEHNTNDFACTRVFMSFYNPNEGIDYIYDMYYPTSLFYDDYGPDWRIKMTPEEKKEKRNLYWIDKKSDLNKEVEDENKNKKNYNMFILCSVIAIIITFMIDGYRTSKNSLKEITILRIHGVKKRTFFMFFAGKALIDQSILLFLGAYITDIYGLEHLYIPPRFILQMLPIYFGILIVSALSSGFMAIYGMRFSKALKVVQSEESIS